MKHHDGPRACFQVCVWGGGGGGGSGNVFQSRLLFPSAFRNHSFQNLASAPNAMTSLGKPLDSFEGIWADNSP